MFQSTTIIERSNKIKPFKSDINLVYWHKPQETNTYEIKLKSKQLWQYGVSRLIKFFFRENNKVIKIIVSNGIRYRYSFLILNLKSNKATISFHRTKITRRNTSMLVFRM